MLAYLPMAWVGDFIFSIGQAYWCGFCVNCPESPETMQTDLREIGPTYYFAPPRVFETQLTNVMIRMEDAGRVKKWLFDHFMERARRVGPAILDGHEVSGTDRLRYRLGQALIYGPLKDTLGFGRVRVGYTAGEAIGPEIFDFYRSLGINLKQLYGQTEASVFITLQPDGEVRSDTVGVPAPGVEVRISDDGEVYYRGPGVFEYYYKNAESTAKTKDPEGWVATGDAGFFEEGSGHLRIIDRAKDVGRMVDGRMFAPKYVENKLKFFPNILEAVVFGHEREMCAAFINIDLTAVGNWAERNNIGYASYQELAGHPRVLDMIQGHVEEVNRSLSDDPMLSHCQVHRFLVLHKELDADDGEMTRTRKVRRNVVSDKFGDLVTALYDGSHEIHTTTEVTYEDGRKGSHQRDAGDPRRGGGPHRHGKGGGGMNEMATDSFTTEDGRTIGGVVMEMKNITLRFGGVVAIKDISFDIREGEIRAIIGPNGAGKSSMLNVISGFYHPQEGEVWYKGERRPPMKPYQVARQGIARTFQNIALFEGMSVLDNVMTGRIRQMKAGLLAQAIWKGPAEAEEVANRAKVERSSIFSRSSTSARRRSRACPTASRSGWSSPARWRPSRRSCCWTSRWRG